MKLQDRLKYKISARIESKNYYLLLLLICKNIII